MAKSFADMKKSRESAMQKLNEEVAKYSTKREKDTRFWYPQRDKAGNGFAVIRFLPAPQNEDVPWVRLWSHAFEDQGGWYIENSLTTIGKPDPVGEQNSALWKEGNEDDKHPSTIKARKQKRKLTYIANILVIKDPATRENEGKVFLYKFGAKIFDKLNAKMNPEFEDDKQVNPFDAWEGANFKLKVKKVGQWPNYDDSEFDSPGAFGTDEFIEQIWKQEFSLAAFIAADQFKSYEELEKRLDKVQNGTKKDKEKEDTNRSEERPSRPAQEAKVGKTKEEKPAAKSAPAKEVPADDGDDDSMKFFEKLAADDDESPL